MFILVSRVSVWIHSLMNQLLPLQSKAEIAVLPAFVLIIFCWIACFSFRVGDLALFIYTEEIDTYVAFTISPSKYFMHSESQAALLAHIGMSVTDKQTDKETDK